MLTLKKQIIITLNTIKILNILLLKKRLIIPFNYNTQYFLNFDFVMFDLILEKTQLKLLDIDFMLQKFYTLNIEIYNIIKPLEDYIIKYPDKVIDNMRLLDILNVIYKETCYVEDFLFILNYTEDNINLYFFRKNILDLDFIEEFNVIEELNEPYTNFQSAIFQSFLLTLVNYFNDRLHNFGVEIVVANDTENEMFLVLFLIKNKSEI